MVKETGQTFHGGHIHAKAPLRGRERWVNLLAARAALADGRRSGGFMLEATGDTLRANTAELPV
jgi:hypothetical protein